MTGPNLAHAAAWYASQGVPVFPLRDGRKDPRTPQGFKDATTDAATVAAWWERWPSANIGAPAGVLFDVIDLDGPEAAAAVDALYPEGWPSTIAQTRTPRPGGRHLFIPVMGAPSKANLRPHLDTRGAGGYVVLPPSVTLAELDPDGTTKTHAGAYAWEGEPPTFGPPDVATLTACRPWRRVWDTPAPTVAPNLPRTLLTPLAGTTPYGARVLDAEAATVAATTVGGRNEALNRAAFKVGQLVPHEVTEADARAALLDAARSCGLPDSEAHTAIGSGLPNGMDNPRHPAERGRPDRQAHADITSARVQSLNTSPESERIDPRTGEVLDAAPVSQDAPQGPASTWTRVDLGATVAGLVAGTLRRAAPTVAPVRGGAALFYPGKVNGLAGESGAGKTWTLLHAAAGILDDGGTVVYIDHEDDPAGIVGRLLDLGVSADAVGARFAYLNPSEKPTAGDLQALAALVADLRPVLVVVDSTGEGLALEGANPNADEEVAAWFLRVPRRLSLVAYDDQPGPAVVVLDHVTKADDGGLWPIGSQRKRAAISGAQYMQRLVKPFDKDTAGHALLVCAKDRHGNYRTGQRVAELHVTPGPVITLDAVEDAARPNGFRPTGYMERVSRALESSPAPLSLNGVRDAVGGKREHVTRALSALVADGYVTTAAGPRGATLHTLVRPFREGDDRSPEDMPESEPGTTVDRAPFLREGNGAQSLDRAPGNGGGTVGHGHHEAPELCPLHGENAHPDACYTCAELAGRGWDE